MLCPKIWNFAPPKHQLNYFNNTEDHDVLNCIDTHFFNHSVSVVFPNASNSLENFNQKVIEDSDYYKIDGVHVVDLVDKEFIESFVKNGELTLLSIENKIDVDNVIAITPDGHLILNILRSTYEKLGIEGKPTFFERQNSSRYVVKIDLKDEKFTPGKKNYERIRSSLERLQSLKFNVILAWDPPKDSICPSSVAAWFENRLKMYPPPKTDNPVKVCCLKTIQRSKNSLSIPSVKNNSDFRDFFEWIGFFSIDAKLINENEEEKYVSSYVIPSPNSNVKTVCYRQYSGFFTRRKMKEIYNLFKDCALENSESLQWCSMDVQGFSDSPVSWDLKEHQFYIDGDNSYTIAHFPNDNQTILRKSKSSNNKPRIKQ